ncbi:MAG: hypothetical protein JNK00_01225 [Flavipsychrobacter sp.]|nr:hypothetical protein [Flavipsychrobacter sp.]
MNSANDIIQELRGLGSKLADMPRTLPYEVPTGYFDAFAGGIMHFVQADAADEPLLQLPKTMPFEVPDGYFDSLTGEVLAKVNEPSLPFTKAMPHTVPEDYFALFPDAVLMSIKKENAGKNETKVIAFSVWKTVRWAAAAIVLLGIGIGAYSYLNTGKPIDTQAQLAMIPGDSISEYVQMHIDDYELETIASSLEPKDLETLTEKLSEEEIENYLNETGWEETTLNL